MTPTPYYAMFTKRGNRAVAAMVDRLLKLPLRTMPEEEVYSAVAEEMAKVEIAYPEVHDTAVRECFIGAIERATGRELSIYEV